MYDEGFRKSLLTSELGLMTFKEVKKDLKNLGHGAKWHFLE